jgi:hypothetical protein
MRQLRIKVQPALLHAVEHRVARPQLRIRHRLVAACLGEVVELEVRDGQVALPLGKVEPGFSPHRVPRPVRRRSGMRRFDRLTRLRGFASFSGRFRPLAALEPLIFQGGALQNAL